MKTDNLFMGVVYYITGKEYLSDGIVTHSRPRTFSLYYLKNNLGVDFITKTKYSFDASELKIGQEYIDITNHKRMSLSDFVIMTENKTNKKYELKDNVSRKDIIKLMKVLAEDLRTIENEKDEKVKRFDLR